MHTAQPHPAPGRAPNAGGSGRRLRWLFAVSGVALLVVSMVMMVIGAQPSRAQTVHPQAPAQLARLRLPAPIGAPDLNEIGTFDVSSGGFTRLPRTTRTSPSSGQSRWAPAIIGGCVSCVRYRRQPNCGPSTGTGRRQSIMNG
jgi:hypothetical protein